MKKIITHSIGILIAILISSLGFVSHGSALSMDETIHMGHGSSSPITCLNTCMSATTEKINEIPNEDKEDVEPTPPHYLQLTNNYPIELVSTILPGDASTLKRPPKNPPYIAFAVFRN